MTSRRFQTAAATLFLAGALVTTSTPDAFAQIAEQLQQPPQYGVYYDRLEPTFYTGFAPRTLEPKRLQLHIGRGNQLRVTVVLSDEVLREYARDLVARAKVYRGLVDSGKIVLTQNQQLEDFERRLAKEDVAGLIHDHRNDSAHDIAEDNLELLRELNPGRVFEIRIDVDDLIRKWTAELRPEDRKNIDSKRRLELLNLLLPTRLFLAETDAATGSELSSLVRLVPEGTTDRHALGQIRPAWLKLLARVSGGIYPVDGDELEFTEFTAIYPIGTWNQTTKVNGRPIPEYPTPGRRALTTHQRTRTPDHIPEEMSYSYFPWLPYMHVGTRMHNALHTLFWSMRTADTSFLPAEWKNQKNLDGKVWQHLWLLSRGQMSHGCTHVNGGHISELRQILPADPDDFSKVDVFYNTSFLYDVFDIDGDLTPEVMGVRYFIAYSLDGKDKPQRLRVRDDRKTYYDWLYAGELSYDSKDRGRFATVKDGRFIDRTAVPGRDYNDIALYEAAYEPERIQFYKAVSIPFARALRRVGARQPELVVDANAKVASRN